MNHNFAPTQFHKIHHLYPFFWYMEGTPFCSTTTSGVKSDIHWIIDTISLCVNAKPKKMPFSDFGLNSLLFAFSTI